MISSGLCDKHPKCIAYVCNGCHQILKQKLRIAKRGLRKCIAHAGHPDAAAGCHHIVVSAKLALEQIEDYYAG